MKQNIFYELIICFLIWGLLGSNTAFAAQDNSDLRKDYLSPRINLSKKSLKKVMITFSRMQVDAALEETAANINEIGRRNFKRELSPRELVVALAMIFEGRSLRDIDNHFATLNYLAEEMGIKEKPKQILRLRIVKAISTGFFGISMGVGVYALDIINVLYSVSIIITAPFFLIMSWFFIGWSVDFFSWIEKKIDPKNKHVFADPIKDLNKKQKKQFRSELKQVMSNIIHERFDRDENPPNNNSARTENLSLTVNQFTFEDRGLSILEINFPGLLLISI